LVNVAVYHPFAQPDGTVVVSVVVDTRLTVKLVEPSCRLGVDRKFAPLIVMFVGLSDETAEGENAVNDGGFIAARSTLLRITLAAGSLLPPRA
jgi:hypothetical protein